MTLYNPPHHLSSQSVQWHPHRRLELKKDKTENLLSYFVSMSHSVFFFFQFFIIFLLQHSVSPSTSLQTVSADTALKHSAS